MPTGSVLFALSALLTISALVLLLLRYYLPLRTTPAYLLVPVFLAIALPSSIVLLVPIDLASSSTTDSTSIRLPNTALLITWRITYWLTFALTWFILPLLGEYCDSGYRDTRARVLDSLRRNARYQLIVLGLGCVGIVYLALQGAASLKGLVMAGAYAWGLVLAIGLMGHGMVVLPKRVWRDAWAGRRLRGLQMKAPGIREKLDEAAEELEGLEGVVGGLRKGKGGVGVGLGEWIEELADTTMMGMAVEGGRGVAVREDGIPAVVTERYLADLTRKLKRARHKKARFEDEWERLCQYAQETQTILDAATTQKLDFGSSKNTTVLTPPLRYHLHAHLLPSLRLTLAAVLAIAGTTLLYSELVKPIFPSISLIALTVSPPNITTLSFGHQLLAALWLTYMCTCALTAISSVRVWGNRALIPRQTYAESATWYSLQIAKLTVPLSYNFITMLPKTLYQETVFYRFLGEAIDLTPLGKGFSAFFPVVLVLPVMASGFNLWGRVSRFGMLEDEDEGSWREGKALIERERSGTTARTGPARGGTRFDSVTNEEEVGGGDAPRHFYQDLGERVRNTFESAERPEWLRRLGTPRWMRDEGRGSGGGRGGGRGGGFGRWFGGGGGGGSSGADGGVRL